MEAASRHIYPKARLLLIDDTAADLKAAHGVFAPYRAAVDNCLSGAQAIEQVKQHDYDIVFMDYMMPGMDGIKTAAAIRALEGERFKTVPIVTWASIAMSGPIREILIEKGINDFLSKPIDTSELDAILYRWIPKEKRQSAEDTPKVSETGEGRL